MSAGFNKTKRFFQHAGRTGQVDCPLGKHGRSVQVQITKRVFGNFALHKKKTQCKRNKDPLVVFLP